MAPGSAGAWKEMQRAEGSEGDSLLQKPRGPRGTSAPTPNVMGKKSSAAGAAGGYSTVGDEAGTDFLDTGFRLRELGPQAMRIWLGLQIVSLFFQLLFWNEVSGHLWAYEEAVSEECAPDKRKHGVCVGPMWNVTTWQDVVLSTTPGQGQPLQHSWEFNTYSKPPTFLLVVDPVSSAPGDQDPPPVPAELDHELKDARWAVDVSRLRPPQTGPSLHKFHVGPGYLTFEDQSAEAEAALRAEGRVVWRATLTQRGLEKRRRFRYAAFVEDASAALQELHSSSQCSLGRSWKAFNDEHQGRSHQMLSWCRSLLGIFLLAGGAAVYAVHEELKKGALGYRFHIAVLAKCILMDVPQQTCIVMYLLGWYDAAGLRCQLCLFHPHRCGAQQAFHLTNLIAIACSLLSSVANQMLIRPIFKRKYSEDDLCVMFCLRLGGVCVSILPFTTGVCLASRSMLPLPALLHVLAAIPCGVGWLTFSGLLCTPIFMCCDEDCAEAM